MPKTTNTRKSKDLTAPRGSQFIDGHLIHTATNQKLFYQTHVCTVFRVTLKPNEQFSTLTAKNVMEKNYKKRQAHGIGSILEDRITLEKDKQNGKTPFRPFVHYREIKDIQRGKKSSKHFVLSVDSEKSGLKYYEVYKCKTDENTKKFVEFIQQGMNDAGKMVRDGPVLDVVPVVDDPNMRRSLVHVDFQTSQESLDENGRLSTMYQTTSPTPPAGYGFESPSPPPKRYSPIPSPVVQKQQMVHAAPPPSPPRKRTPSPPRRMITPSPPRRRTPSPPRRMRTPSPQYRAHNLDELDGVTYIKYDAKKCRHVESNEGPIYMYLSRQINKQGRSSPSRGRTGSPDYNSGMYNGRPSDYYRY